MLRKGFSSTVGTLDHLRTKAKHHHVCKELEKNGVDTIEKMFNFLHSRYAERPCVGSRQILSVEHEKSKELGKLMKKFNMGEYTWMTYDEVFNKALNFGRGLKELSYESGTKVVMYADTRGRYHKSSADISAC